MQYTKADERAPVTPIRPMTGPDYRHNSDIRRTRTILLVLLIIQTLFSLYSLIQRSVDLAKYNRTYAYLDTKQSGLLIGQVVTAVFSLIYFVVFIFVVFKYIRTGILIFAWLGLIELVIVLILIILAIVTVIAASAKLDSAAVGIVASVILVVIVAIVWILLLLIVIFAFRLAKYLRLHENYQTV